MPQLQVLRFGVRTNDIHPRAGRLPPSNLYPFHAQVGLALTKNTLKALTRCFLHHFREETQAYAPPTSSAVLHGATCEDGHTTAMTRNLRAATSHLVPLTPQLGQKLVEEHHLSGSMDQTLLEAEVIHPPSLHAST